MSIGKYRSREIRFVATEDGGAVCDDHYGYDATLEVIGDFPSQNDRIAYAEAIAAALNSAEIPVWLGQ